MIRNSFKIYVFLLLFTSSINCQEENIDVRTYPDFTWKADLGHSSISFRTMHWGIVEIIGWFEKYDVTLKKEGDDWTSSEIIITIKPESVRLPNMGMAQSLQGSDLFYTEKFPEILFKSNKIVQKSDSVYVVSGELTIKETTRNIDWDVKFNGDVIGTPGFTAIGSFTLPDFNMNLSKNEYGGRFFDVGDTVWVRCNFRLEAEW